MEPEITRKILTEKTPRFLRLYGHLPLAKIPEEAHQYFLDHFLQSIAYFPTDEELLEFE